MCESDSNSATMRYLQCLKYKTDQHKDVKRVEKLNNFFLRLMCTEEVTAQTAAAISAAIEEEGSLSYIIYSMIATVPRSCVLYQYQKGEYVVSWMMTCLLLCSVSNYLLPYESLEAHIFLHENTPPLSHEDIRITALLWCVITVLLKYS
jgi:hypothetical protein